MSIDGIVGWRSGGFDKNGLIIYALAMARVSEVACGNVDVLLLEIKRRTAFLKEPYPA
jgi:hypothetical protein